MNTNYDNNCVHTFRKSLRAMETSICLACPHHRSQKRSVYISATLAVPADPTTLQSTDISEEWKNVNTAVTRDHNIPQKTAANIPVSVPNGTTGCDISLEGPSLPAESTLHTVQTRQ